MMPCKLVTRYQIPNKLPVSTFIFYPEEISSTLILNVDICLPNYMAWYPNKL